MVSGARTGEPLGLVRAQSGGAAGAAQPQPKPKLIRRHSSGDHAFLPDQNSKNAIKDSKKNFGARDLPQDAEVCSRQSAPSYVERRCATLTLGHYLVRRVTVFPPRAATEHIMFMCMRGARPRERLREQRG